MVRNWLIFASVVFGVGFSLSLPITRQVKNSALIGLVTIPASAAGAFVVSRQRQQEVFAVLETEIKVLEQQKDALKRSLQTLSTYQEAVEATYAEKQRELEAQIQQLQAQLDEGEQQKQSAQREFTALEEKQKTLRLDISELQEIRETLEQHKQSLEQAIAELENQQHSAENALEALAGRRIALDAQIQQLQAQVRADEQQKQALQQELQVLGGQWQTVQANLALLQQDVETLEQQKQVLEQAVMSDRQQAQLAETRIEELGGEASQLQAQIKAGSQQKQALQQELMALEARKQSLTKVVDRLTAKVQNLRTQEATLNTSLSALTTEQQALDSQLKTREQEQRAIQQELSDLETHRQALSSMVDVLERQLQELRTQKQQVSDSLNQQSEERQKVDIDLSQLRSQLQIDRQQYDTLTQELEALRKQEEQLQEQISTLTQEQGMLLSQRDEWVEELQQHRQQHDTLTQRLGALREQESLLQEQISTLTQERETLLVQRNNLDEECRQLQAQIQSAQVQQSQYGALRIDSPSPTYVVSESLIDTPHATEHQIDPPEPAPALSVESIVAPVASAKTFRPLIRAIDFRLVDSEHTEWLWEEVLVPRWHYRPFLGSIYLPREDTDEVWGTETILTIVGDNLKRLGENNLNCDRIYDRFGDENHLYWLKILTFAMSDYAYYMESEGGFWRGLCDRLELSYQSDNAIPVTTLKKLAEDGIELLKLPKAVEGYPIVSTLWLQSGIPCRNLHHFADLVADLGDELNWRQIQNTDAAALARKLLNTCQSRYPGRTVLQRFLDYSCQPDTEPVSGELLQSIASVAIALQDYNQQPDILLNPAQRQEFFVEKVPQFKFFLRDWDALVQVLSPDRPIRSRRSPGQKSLALRLDLEDFIIELVLPEQTLRNADWPAGICQIPAAGWQGEIDASGQIEIEEYTQTISQISESWDWQLLDEQGNCLHSWYLEGIMPDFPCLVFDAWTGDRLLPNPALTDCQEIFCFVPTETTIEFTGSVERAEESPIPCSIQRWQGKRLRLTGQAGQLEFQFGSATSTLGWTMAPTLPSLRGLNLPGQAAYLEPPTLWYPPHTEALALSLTLEERGREDAAPTIQQTVTLEKNDRWFEIPLREWLKSSGQYTIHLSSSAGLNWSQDFEVQAAYQVTAEDILALPAVQVTDHQGLATDLPLRVAESSQFWATTISIAGLWPLEPLKLLLSNGEHPISQSRSADKTGQLTLELSTLHDLLPTSNQYFLDYQRSGQAQQPLVQLVKEIPLSWTWGDRTLDLTGLKTDRAYHLIGWNLLTPQHPSLEIPVPNGTSATVNLDVPPGIYYWQLAISKQPSAEIGWWCDNDRDDFQIAPETDEDLANYYYAILDNALIDEFQRAASKLSWDEKWIEAITASLAAGNHHFPNWLNAEALLAKLRSMINPVHGQQYTISTARSKRRDFEKKLQEKVAQENLWQLILGFQAHPDPNERNLAFITLSDRERAHAYLKQIADFKWLSRETVTLETVDQEVDDS
jgi:predicted  nucleic acid-binding Zn-ribbon protein